MHDERVTSDYRPATLEPGTIIAGRYTLVERIGEGGMGEVWVARQSEPVKRKVAVKLIKPGMDTRAVLTRFEQERQALAVMDHPNIAKVLDGGMSDAGRPFFVMELVPGLPLTRFCDQAKLGISERLEIFVTVCQAVQHAHQKGIIHRDLKPSNILVGLVDGRPTPKVIDFGVAKAIAGKLTDETVSTQLGAVVGTLEYMPPEQAGLSLADIDTRADIYALGVILYEMLTGLRPFDTQRLRQAALDEMIRIIREEEPSKPSTRLSSDASLPSLAAARQSDPHRLTNLLRGDLDSIVMKALEKDRNRRYETANGFAADVQRYLLGEPVLAHPPSASYRLRKFLKRNRGPVLAAALLAIALLGGLVGTSLFAWEAKRQAELAKKNEVTASMRAAETAAALKTVSEQRDKIGHQKDEITRALYRIEDERAEALVRQFMSGKAFGQLDPVEAAVFVDLSIASSDRVKFSFLEMALDRPGSAARIAYRSDYLIHAIVGLSTQRKEQAIELLRQRWQGGNVSAATRMQIVTLGVRLGWAEPEMLTTAADYLIQESLAPPQRIFRERIEAWREIERICTPKQRSELAAKLVAAIERVPDALDDRLRDGPIPMLWRGLDELTRNMDAAEAQNYFSATAAKMTLVLGMMKSYQAARLEFPREFANVLGRLTADSAREHAHKAARLLLARLIEQKYPLEQEQFARLLLVVTESFNDSETMKIIDQAAAFLATAPIGLNIIAAKSLTQLLIEIADRLGLDRSKKHLSAHAARLRAQFDDRQKASQYSLRFRLEYAEVLDRLQSHDAAPAWTAAANDLIDAVVEAEKLPVGIKRTDVLRELTARAVIIASRLRTADAGVPAARLASILEKSALLSLERGLLLPTFVTLSNRLAASEKAKIVDPVVTRIMNELTKPGQRLAVLWVKELRQIAALLDPNKARECLQSATRIVVGEVLGPTPIAPPTFHLGYWAEALEAVELGLEPEQAQKLVPPLLAYLPRITPQQDQIFLEAWRKAALILSRKLDPAARQQLLTPLAELASNRLANCLPIEMHFYTRIHVDAVREFDPARKNALLVPSLTRALADIRTTPDYNLQLGLAGGIQFIFRELDPHTARQFVPDLLTERRRAAQFEGRGRNPIFEVLEKAILTWLHRETDRDFLIELLKHPLCTDGIRIQTLNRLSELIHPLPPQRQLELVEEASFILIQGRNAPGLFAVVGTARLIRTKRELHRFGTVGDFIDWARNNAPELDLDAPANLRLAMR